MFQRVEVDDLVIYPLNQMLQMFEGPSNVIQKRYDKLLDYDNLKRKSQSDKVCNWTLDHKIEIGDQSQISSI
jgi:hypothetical protein